MSQEYEYPPNVTFISEDIPPATSFMQSGKSLRASHAARLEAKFITDMLIEGEEDPNNIKEEQWQELRSEWKKEAELKFPDQGDYKIWLLDPETNEPVPIGEMVEFVGGAVRENPGILPCKEYELNLSGVVIPNPNTFIINISYTDCTITQVTISDTAAKLEDLTICVGQATIPVTSAGVFTEIGPCVVGGDEGGGLPCEQYSWNLSGVPSNNIVSVGFTNCAGNSEKIEGKPAELGTLVNFCAVKDTAFSNSGTINYIGGPCVNPYNPNNNL
jgi:hypothetical protein